MLPELPYTAWAETKATLHLWFQIVGKIKLALMPRQNHWWHITLRVNALGVGTGPIPCEGAHFEVRFNFLAHCLEVLTSRGAAHRFPLQHGLSVADFYRQLWAALQQCGIRVEIQARPYDNPHSTTPFAQDTTHAHYAPEAVHKYWTALRFIDEAFQTFNGRFNGKTSPVQLFWHSFDLAVARYSGKAAPREGGTRSDREAYSHEVIAHGWWPGDPAFPEAAFYSYLYPGKPEVHAQDLPGGAFWNEGTAILRHADVLTSPNTRQTVLDFCQRTYELQAQAAGWATESFQLRPLA